MLDSGLVGGISTQADTISSNELNFSVVVHIFIRFIFLMEHFFLIFLLKYQNVYDHQTFQNDDMLQETA